nr:fur family transcriptional regulator FurA3 [Streptoalloteichus tenebrarius]
MSDVTEDVTEPDTVGSNPEGSNPDHTAGLVERMQEAGLRATAPRLAVAEALREMGGHRTADDVHAHLVRAGTRIPRASVYNVLAALTGAGICTVADIGHGPAVYELDRGWHHHFVCRSCGRVFDVDCLVGASPCLTAGDSVGVIEQAQVIFRGVCADCQENK